MIKKFDLNLALRVFKKANAHAKVIQCLTETGQTDAALNYSRSTGFSLDY